MPDNGQTYYWTCDYAGCSHGGSAESQGEADAVKAFHMAGCDKKPG